MKNDYYQNQQSFKAQLGLLKDILDETEKFVVWNGDIGLDEIVEMKIQLFRLENLLATKLKVI